MSDRDAERVGAIGLGESLPEHLPESPADLFRAWFDEAAARGIQPNPDAMTLATVDPDGRPSARIVLCKALHEKPGFLVFYTNALGRKGRALAANPRAAAVLHWDALDRQIRVEGPVVRSPEAESDAYFISRRWESRVGAWASEQSEPVASRDEMMERVRRTAAGLGVDLSAASRGGSIEITRPPHWGGYRLWFDRVELWCGGLGRVHDRAEWRRGLTPAREGFESGPWTSTRLQP